MKPFSHTMSVV